MKKKLLIFLLLFLSLISINFAAVEMFDKYDTTINFLNDNTLSVSKNIVIQNTHTVGIVPGRVEFKINKDSDSLSFIDDSLKVTNKYGINVKHKLIKTKNSFIIAVDIYTPILPGFKYNLNLDYKLNYNAHGFLFKSAVVPLKEDLSVPIKSGTLNLILEDNKKFTYLNYRDNSTILNKNKVTYNFNKNTPSTLNFEYSLIPIDIFHFKGSYVFWISINILLLLLLFFELKKELQPRKNNKKSKSSKK